MSRMICVLVMLLAIAFLAQSKPLVQLGGNDGNTLLRDLTNNSTNNSLDLGKGNNIVINLSQSTTSMQLGGSNGTSVLKNLTGNSSDLLGANHTMGNLTTWGSTPREAPLPPIYDPKRANAIEILRQNHLG